MKKYGLLKKLEVSLTQYFFGIGHMKKYGLLKKLQVALTEYNNSNEENNLTSLFIHLRKAGDYVDLNINSNGHLKDLEDLVIKARNRIWENHLYLVKPIAKRYFKIFRCFLVMDLSDFILEGNLGLFKAILHCDVDEGLFPNYTIRVIKESIDRAIYRNWRPIKIPYLSPKNFKMLGYISENFQKRLGRSPTNKELAHLMHKKVNSIKELKWTEKYLCNLLSLDFPILKDGGVIGYLIDNIIDENSYFEDRVINEFIFSEAMKRLTLVERKVFESILQGKNFREIAKENNFSKARAHNAKMRGVKKMKEFINESSTYIDFQKRWKEIAFPSLPKEKITEIQIREILSELKREKCPWIKPGYSKLRRNDEWDCLIQVQKNIKTLDDYLYN